jgi:hypothetical protein
MTDVVVSIKAIKPKKLKVDAISQQILFALQDESKDHKRLLGQTTQTWGGAAPTPESLIDLSRGGDAVVISGMGGSAEGIKKWNFLNEGTKVRRAVMSKGWQSKTAPGRLRSGRGRGRVVFISRRISRPGIKPRGWTQRITKMRRKPFQRRITKAMQRGAQGLF